MTTLKEHLRANGEHEVLASIGEAELSTWWASCNKAHLLLKVLKNTACPDAIYRGLACQAVRSAMFDKDTTVWQSLIDPKSRASVELAEKSLVYSVDRRDLFTVYEEARTVPKERSLEIARLAFDAALALHVDTPADVRVDAVNIESGRIMHRYTAAAWAAAGASAPAPMRDYVSEVFNHALLASAEPVWNETGKILCDLIRHAVPNPAAYPLADKWID